MGFNCQRLSGKGVQHGVVRRGNQSRLPLLSELILLGEFYPVCSSRISAPGVISMEGAGSPPGARESLLSRIVPSHLCPMLLRTLRTLFLRWSQHECKAVGTNHEFVAIFENPPDHRLSGDKHPLTVRDLVNHEASLPAPDPDLDRV